MMEENDRIELRSEKVRNIIGEETPPFVRYGITVVFAVLLFVSLVTYFFYKFKPTWLIAILAH